MNERIATERFDSYLRLLQRMTILARSACQAGDPIRAEAILDAVHNLPRFLIGEERAEFEADFVKFYMLPLLGRYPDLGFLLDEIPRS